MCLWSKICKIKTSQSQLNDFKKKSYLLSFLDILIICLLIDKKHMIIYVRLKSKSKKCIILIELLCHKSLIRERNFAIYSFFYIFSNEHLNKFINFLLLDYATLRQSAHSIIRPFLLPRLFGLKNESAANVLLFRGKQSSIPARWPYTRVWPLVAGSFNAGPEHCISYTFAKMVHTHSVDSIEE